MISMIMITEFEHKSSINSYKNLIVYKEEEYKDNLNGN
jgi:hypothetical protein